MTDRPPRPHDARAASPEEAAAIVAAVERFVAERPSREPSDADPSPWARAALLAAAGHDAGGVAPWD